MAVTWSYVRPNTDLESPFSVKHQHRHLPFLRPNNSSLVEHLYELTMDTAESSWQELWVSCKLSSGHTSLKLREIQESVSQERCLGVSCFNLAVRNLLAEDAENFGDTKCMGWRHYVYQDWAMDATRGNEYSSADFSRSRFTYESSAYDVFGAHLVLIPVLHDGHYTLYAFDMCNQKLSILDSSFEDPEQRHEEIRLQICGALNQTLATPSDGSQEDFSRWEYQFPQVPRQEHSYDSGFFVFNFMRLWDGYRLAKLFPTESLQLRKDFLAYIMCFKENEANLPHLVASCISNLSEGKKMARKSRQTWAMYPMDSTLLKAAKDGNHEEVGKLLDLEVAPHRNANLSVDVVVVNDIAADTVGTHSAAIDTRGNEVDNQTSVQPTGVAQANPLRPRLSSMLIRGVTSEGDGLLHIAARYTHRNLAIAICRRARIRIAEIELAPAPAGSSSQQRHENEADHTAQVTLPFAKFLRAKNHRGETCLHEAVRSGCMDIVSLLIAADAELNDETTPPLVQILDDDGASPLYLATTLRRDDIVQTLIADRDDCKYDVSYAGPDGKTALHAAVLWNTEKVSKLLLKWKRRLATKPDESGRTPLHYANALAITELILQQDSSSGYSADSEGSLPIHVAASMGRLDIIAKLLEECPNCDSLCDAAGRTFLHVAVQKKHNRVVKYVCTKPKLRTILNMRDHNGDTALHMAVKNGSWSIFCSLFRIKEVSLNLVNKQGRTPLDVAIASNTEKLSMKQVNWAWIRNDLLAAGGGFGPRGSDDFPWSSGSDRPEVDKEKESERLRNSAALLGTGAFLILTIALQAPFNVADKKVQIKMIDSLSAETRAAIYGDFVYMDAYALSYSLFSILCFTTAGLPYILPHGARSAFLIVGGFFLCIAVSGFLLAFANGLSLVFPRGIAIFFIYIVIYGIALCTPIFVFVISRPERFLAHVLARVRRLGCRGWLRSLFRCHARGSWTPLMHVVFFGGTLFLSGLCIKIAYNSTQQTIFIF